MGDTQREIHRFLSRTSLKGVPRIVGSDLLVLRWIWIVAVLFGILTSGIFTSMLTYDYFSRTVTVSINEKSTIPEGVADTSLYRAALLCNLNPFTSNVSRYRDKVKVTPETFFSMVENATRCNQCSVEDKQIMNDLRDDLMTPSGYYQFVGPTLAREVGHQREDFIIDCQIIVADGAHKRHISCADMLHLLSIRQVTTPEFLNCFEARFKPVKFKVPVVGFTLSVYLDNFHSNSFSRQGSRQWDNGYSAGIHISFFDNTSVPPIRGIDMPAGHVSNVVGNLHRRTRLSKPYGTCRGRDSITMDHRGSKLMYSKRMCRSICFERAVYEHCKCVDVRSSCLLEDRYLAEGASYCQSLARGMDYVRNKSICASHIRRKYLTQCTDECPQPCDEVIYNSRVFQAKWPEVMHHVAFYNDIIKNKHFAGERFKVYENITSNFNTADQQALFTYASLIQNNFAKIKFSINEPRYDHMEDQPKTTISELVSQLGGILNLWSGITFLLLIEVLDMVFRICHAYCKGNDSGEPPEAHNLEVMDVNGENCPSKENVQGASRSPDGMSLQA